MQGYGHPSYAASLSDFGTPRFLPRSEGWILERSIDGFPHHDAMGCYPLFVCQDWSHLNSDLEQITDGLVCLSLVADPFGEYDPDYLRRCFPDVMLPFKEHFVIDLSLPLDTFVHSHHRRNARKALREIKVEKCTNPGDLLDDWTNLYSALIKRHHISGIAAFSRESFARQFSVPGVVVFRAVADDTTVGMLLWYIHGNRAYYHLGAYSARGYELRASFALFDYSIKYFAEREFEWLNLGSGAGVASGGEQGLSRFKQGWSTGVRTAYFCGRILDQEKYDTILKARRLPPTKYFPAYRVGEFQ
jgi:hypothetical protein